MSTERGAGEGSFGFTENEELWERMSHKRFLAILGDDKTRIHNVVVSTNTYGESLFVTVSRMASGERQGITFWGLGFHESRERWLKDEWRWYEVRSDTKALRGTLTKDEAQTLIQNRREDVEHWSAGSKQSSRGKLFEMLADLTDEDGAYSEMKDLGWPDDVDL